MEFDVISPKTKDELLSVIQDHQDKRFKIGAGMTDLLNQFKSQKTDDLTVISISSIDEPSFSVITEQDEYIEVGTLVTASDLINSELIKNDYPVLHKAAQSVASIQIRNMATIGGNICNVSPSGDMTVALVAIESVCCILSSDGTERKELLRHFILGERKTSMAKNEILMSIHIPKNSSLHLNSGFEKVGSRKAMEISIVAIAYHFQLNESGTILHAGIAVGAMASNIPFAESASDYLIGKNIHMITDEEREEFAKKVVSITSPISDIRATAWYRTQVLSNLSKTILE